MVFAGYRDGYGQLVEISHGKDMRTRYGHHEEVLVHAGQSVKRGDVIANALKKIGAHSTGSRLESPQADENSHLFFGAIRSFSSMMATHPPLEARIKALDPNWVPAANPNSTASSSRGGSGAAGASGAASFAGNMTGAPVSQLSGSANLPAAQRMIETADTNLKQASHDTFEARAMVYAMLLSQEQTVRANQTQLISQTVCIRSYEDK